MYDGAMTPVVIISGKHPLYAKSGYATYAAALARELTKYFDVHIYCAGAAPSREKSAIGTIHVVGSAFARLFPGREMNAFIPISIALARHIPRHSIVWGIGPWTLAGALAGPKTLVADYFTTIRHEWGIPFFSPVERYILAKSDRIVTHYHSTERILTDEFDLSAQKFIRVPYPLTPAVHIPLLVTVCRQDTRKGIPYLIEAYRILTKKKLSFQAVIIGTGNQLEKNKRLAAELTNVSFVGEAAHIEPFLRAASAFVLPSLEEGSGSIAVLEAMRAGLPIISTSADGIPEDVPKSCGILVPPGNAKKLAGAIGTVLAKPALQRTMGTTASTVFETFRLRSTRQFSKKFFETLFS